MYLCIEEIYEIVYHDLAFHQFINMNIIENYVKSNKISGIPIENHHIAKLYEMCNNVIENENTNNTIAIEKVADIFIIKIPIEGKARSYRTIHWFELCTTHLCFHICSDPLKYLKYTIDYSMLVNKVDTKHPIDYLYEEYNLIRDLFKNVFNYVPEKTKKLKNFDLK